MRLFIPISMQVLNTNINEDLILTNAHGVVRKDVNTGQLVLHGGSLDDLTGRGALIRIHGKGDSGRIQFDVPNAAGNGDVQVMSIQGNADNPEIDMFTHRLSNVGAPTANNDALRFMPWTDWVPALVWATANPAGVTTVARYVQIGKMLFFTLFIMSADSNATTGLTVTLPVTPSNLASYIMPVSRQLVQATWYDPKAIITQDGAENRILFQSFQTGIDGQTIRIYIEGFYEVA